MEKFSINIADDFSPVLGGRWIALGQFSGELFYDKILEPLFKQVIPTEEKLHVYLDGTKGYGSSFLDQSFGELGRKYSIEKVSSKIVFHTKYFAWYAKYIKEEIWVKR